MTQSKNTKRALTASVLSLVLCFTMLIGSTFAWFTDTATTGVNKIVAGNLDIALYYGTVKEGKISYDEVVDDETKLFDDKALWEPGYTEVAYLKVENIGTLALKALLTVNFSNQKAGISVEGNEIKLSNYLMYDLIEIEKDDFYGTRELARSAAGTEAKLIATEQNEIYLEAKASPKYYALVVYMPENVGNEANYRGDDIPSIDLGVTVIATQDTVESDSWDNLYDKNSEYPSSIKNNAGLLEALQSSDNVVIKNGNYTLPIAVPANKSVTVEGGDFAATDSGANSAFSVAEGGKLTISASDIVATNYNTAIEADPGSKLIVNEGTYATTDIQVISANTNVDVVITGGEYTGTVAVWMNSGTTVDISGGVFTGTAVVLSDGAVPATCVVAISGGTFNTQSLDAGTGVSATITGGSFKFDPTSWLGEGVSATYNDETGYWIVQ